jgi:hypothetical protein
MLLALLNLILKNQEASILFSSKKATHCRTKQHYNWQHPNDSEENHKPI